MNSRGLLLAPLTMLILFASTVFCPNFASAETNVFKAEVDTYIHREGREYSGVLGLIKTGESAKVLEEVNGGWLKVIWVDGMGLTVIGYVRKDPPKEKPIGNDPSWTSPTSVFKAPEPEPEKPKAPEVFQAKRFAGIGFFYQRSRVETRSIRGSGLDPELSVSPLVGNGLGLATFLETPLGAGRWAARFSLGFSQLSEKGHVDIKTTLTETHPLEVEHDMIAFSSLLKFRALEGFWLGAGLGVEQSLSSKISYSGDNGASIEGEPLNGLAHIGLGFDHRLNDQGFLILDIRGSMNLLTETPNHRFDVMLGVGRAF